MYQYYYRKFTIIMKRQVISIFFLFIISFQVIPIKSFFNWEQMEMSQDITEDAVEKSEAKSKNLKPAIPYFLNTLSFLVQLSVLF